MLLYTPLITQEDAMIKMSVLYPQTANSTFDIDYYVNTHMPLCARLIGGALKGYGVEKGLASGAPGQPAPYACIGYLLFDSLEAMAESFVPKAGEMRADIPNYTNVAPTVQISEITLTK
jgi:uncharacterized protein (TIGR02118 family)